MQSELTWGSPSLPTFVPALPVNCRASAGIRSRGLAWITSSRVGTCRLHVVLGPVFATEGQTDSDQHEGKHDHTYGEADRQSPDPRHSHPDDRPDDEEKDAQAVKLLVGRPLRLAPSVAAEPGKPTSAQTRRQPLQPCLGGLIPCPAGPP